MNVFRSRSQSVEIVSFQTWSTFDYFQQILLGERMETMATSSLEEPLLPQERLESSSQQQEESADAPEASLELNPSRSFSTAGDDDLPSRADNSENNDPVPRNPYRNPNVVLSFLLCIVSGVADSIWGSVILSAFLLALAKLMGHESKANTLVGSAEAVQGLTELVSALPIGYLADHVWGKAKVVRLGGILMIVTIGITLAALWDVQQYAEENRNAAKRSYWILVVALGMWVGFEPSMLSSLSSPFTGIPGDCEWYQLRPQPSFVFRFHCPRTKE